MKIRVVPRSGFCGGVKRAISLLEEALEEGKSSVYTLGPIIHNPVVVEAYRKRGVEPLEGLSGLRAGSTVVVRTHGAPLELERRLAALPVDVVDATCQHVKRVQRLIEREKEKGRYVYIAGRREHPEVVAHLSRCGGAGEVLGSADDAGAVEEARSPAALVVQTTFSSEEFDRIKEVLKRKVPDLVVHDSICEAVRRVQREAGRVAAGVDVMLVLGGRGSSNTRRLAEVCAAGGAETHLVERAEELEREWFAGAEAVGIAAGASTPPDSIEAVKKWLREEFDAVEDDEEKNN